MEGIPSGGHTLWCAYPVEGIPSVRLPEFHIVRTLQGIIGDALSQLRSIEGASHNDILTDAVLQDVVSFAKKLTE